MTSPIQQSNSRKYLATALKLLLPCLILAGGIYASHQFMQGKPHRPARPGQPPSRTVDVETIMLSRDIPQIVVQGAVEPKRTISLRSQLRGLVTTMAEDLVPGGYVKAGETLLNIDLRDHALAVKEAQATLDRHQALYQVEYGRRRAAELEYALSGQSLAADDLDLVLRGPQLAQIEADIARSQAALQRAELNYERTRITVPFDAQIVSLDVAKGSLLRDNSSIAELVATDTFWLRVSVPAHQLQWITVPDNGRATDSKGKCLGSAVTIRNPHEWGPRANRQGCVVSLLPTLDNKVKLAHLLIEIQDPLARQPQNSGKPKVLLNAFLQAEIDTNPFENVARIPRRHLQQEKFVWLMAEDGTLVAQPVSVTFRAQDYVLIDNGLNDGDQLITTPLPGAVEGIHLEVRQVPLEFDLSTADSPSTDPQVSQQGEPS
ncbi:efflux RND transporter periplasmic adaptor subunit [Photobacterium rosenbergii]|uniref:Efflux RND transporter periplasmic adaptor subunit n=1 Tax=Photobacterium rosenbergii TaxID=294936 RepID=A0ABU3ZHD0_9GAMM|nr:efflux RND transporter periplasmic adaptor subunit [Photobacterium rosenbergii]MDV5169541.1 efflux RND transporter periplasmic adaptor subunit [Photobacterium rosenbergii]